MLLMANPQALSIHQTRRHKFTRSASLNNSPGPQALSIHKVRRPCKFTRSAGLINAPVPQALSIHQARRPYQFTRSACRINSPGPQALSINQVRRPYQFTWSSFWTCWTFSGQATDIPLHSYPAPQAPKPIANLAGGRIMVACKNNVPEPR